MPHDITTRILRDTLSGEIFGLPATNASDNLPRPDPSMPSTSTIRGLDGIGEASHCGDMDGAPEITLSLTSTGVIRDNTVVSFSPPAALAFAYAIIAQVQAAGFVPKHVPAAPGVVRGAVEVV